MSSAPLSLPLRGFFLDLIEPGFGLVFKSLLSALADGVGLALHDLAPAPDDFVLGPGRIGAAEDVAIARAAFVR